MLKTILAVIFGVTAGPVMLCVALYVSIPFVLIAGLVLGMPTEGHAFAWSVYYAKWVYLNTLGFWKELLLLYIAAVIASCGLVVKYGFFETNK